ncbi:hypothetical protein L208DRAFT_1387075 [Tricholoma matsutake]|nr:hypothetical protein L208DRAFT_1387075 [Tricholoma matsutake 945]
MRPLAAKGYALWAAHVCIVTHKINGFLGRRSARSVLHDIELKLRAHMVPASTVAMTRTCRRPISSIPLAVTGDTPLHCC